MMPMRWVLAASAVLVAAACGLVALSGAEHPTASARPLAVETVKVERGDLSAVASGTGTLTYRARPDGSPYAVINETGGVYTELPGSGDKVGCGGVLYRVDDKPVVMLCGEVPAYRGLHVGEKGRDVRQLNRNLRKLGYARDAHVRIARDENSFTPETEQALKALQRSKGVGVTGRVARGDVVFEPEPIRIAKVTGQIGEPARPGAPVLSATSNSLHVQVNLDASQQGDVKRGDRVRVVLPGNTPVAGRVAGFGRVAQSPDGHAGPAADATIPTFVKLDDPAKARGLERAPVDVDITTEGVDNALSVPVTALVGKSGGGFAVEVVRDGGRRELVGVTLGLFDTGGGRVQVEGGVRAGDKVVVPSL